MSNKLTDILISYLLKGGVLLETKGEFETDIDIPVIVDGAENKISVRVRCKDLQIRTIKGEKEVSE